MKLSMAVRISHICSVLRDVCTLKWIIEAPCEFALTHPVTDVALMSCIYAVETTDVELNQ